MQKEQVAQLNAFLMLANSTRRGLGGRGKGSFV